MSNKRNKPKLIWYAFVFRSFSSLFIFYSFLIEKTWTYKIIYAIDEAKNKFEPIQFGKSPVDVVIQKKLSNPTKDTYNTAVRLPTLVTIE